MLQRHVHVRRYVAAALIAPVLILVAAGGAAAGCSTIDHRHGAWDALLQRFVRDGSVDYSAWQRDGRGALDDYLGELSGTCAADYETWSRDQRLAFWVNAYNAFTVELILDHYPIASIRKIGWLPGAAFRREFIPMPELRGGTVSLDDIEHRTLRADFAEPRVHFALVCASRSCPPLRAESYRAADLDRQLDDQARAFLRDPSKNRFDAATGTLYLSRIFDWFGADFTTGGKSLPAFVAPYFEAPRPNGTDIEVEFLDYDWSLNDTAAAP